MATPMGDVNVTTTEKGSGDIGELVDKPQTSKRQKPPKMKSDSHRGVTGVDDQMRADKPAPKKKRETSSSSSKSSDSTSTIQAKAESLPSSPERATNKCVQKPGQKAKSEPVNNQVRHRGSPSKRGRGRGIASARHQAMPKGVVDEPSSMNEVVTSLSSLNVSGEERKGSVTSTLNPFVAPFVPAAVTAPDATSTQVHSSSSTFAPSAPIHHHQYASNAYGRHAPLPQPRVYPQNNGTFPRHGNLPRPRGVITSGQFRRDAAHLNATSNFSSTQNSIQSSPSIPADTLEQQPRARPRDRIRKPASPSAEVEDNANDAHQNSQGRELPKQKRRNEMNRATIGGVRVGKDTHTRSQGEQLGNDVADERHRPTQCHSTYLDTVDDKGFTDLARSISNSLLNNTYECMICYEVVGRRDDVWSCNTCYKVMHLSCVRAWAYKSQQKEAAMPQSKITDGWRCPGCQSVCVKIPRHYSCFCGKVTNPEWDPYEVPHTCGGICGKRQTVIDSNGRSVLTSCTHKCILKCHPGPCSQCERHVTTKCLCGKKSVRVRCGETDENIMCKNVCARILSCSKHQCERDCHAPPCGDCELKQSQLCYCNKSTREARCGEGDIDISRLDVPAYYSCGSLCNRDLACRNHKCTRTCHAGECPPCTLGVDQAIYCPCSNEKTADILKKNGAPERTSCLDPLPTCDNVCNKILACSTGSDVVYQHRCKSKCHTGVCPPCDDARTVTCRCGQETKKMACVEWGKIPVQSSGGDGVFTCNRVCQRKLSCKRHRCQEKCCVLSQIASEADREGVHTCRIICGRQLSCGKHKCTEICHSTRCPPCLQASFDELSCHCGKTVQYPPIPCGALPPACQYPCMRTHECSHSVRHVCHNEPQCPPCAELVDKRCLGGHEIRRFIPCHVKEVICGEKCGKPLPCGHRCIRRCHGGDCETAMDAKGNNAVAACGQTCGRLLPGCGHNCLAPCHPGTTCPLPCQQQIQITCRCGNKRTSDTCNSTRRAPLATPGHIAFAQSGEDEAVALPLDDLVQDRRYLACDEECAARERNKGFADSLKGILESIDSVKPFRQASYSSFLQLVAQQNPSLIKMLEKYFHDVIASDTEAGFVSTRQGIMRKSPTQMPASLPPMPHDQRKAVHELAQYYGLETLSEGRDPHRFVKVRRTPHSSVPLVLLSKASKTAGHASVPKKPAAQGKIRMTKAVDCPAHGIVVSRIPVTLTDQAIAEWVGQSTASVFEVKRLTPDSAVIIFGDGNTTAAKIAYDRLKDTPDGFMYDLTPGWTLEETAQAGWVTISRTALPSKPSTSSLLPPRMQPAKPSTSTPKVKVMQSTPIGMSMFVQTNIFSPLPDGVQDASDVVDDWEQLEETPSEPTEEQETSDEQDG